MRIRKHGGLVDVDKNGAVIITPFSGQQVDITGDVDISGAITKDGVAILAGLDAMVYKGVIDCSANPNYPAANAGDTYKISVAGKIGGASGESVQAGDFVICNTDGTLAGTEAQRGAAWDVIQSNIVNAAGIVNVPAGNIAATDVQTALNELDTEKAAVAEPIAAAHIIDAADAHAASAITNTPAGGIAATTVQAAIDELDSEKSAAADLLTESNQRIGNDAQYIRTTNGAQTLLGGNAVARAIIIVVEVDTTFAVGDGAAPIFDIGETGNLTKFKAGLTTGNAGDKLTYAGFLSANTALVITATAATGATSTGAIHVTAIALPEA